MNELALTGAGLLAGALGTLVGLGGGFIVVPFMLILFHVPHALAAGTSLVMIFFNSLSGAYAYYRQNRIDTRTGIRFALATLPGAVLGALISPQLESQFFEWAFALLTVSAAVYLIFKPQGAGQNRIPAHWGPLENRSWTDASGQLFTYSINIRVGMIISFFVGFLSSILGIGGGIVHVPVMIFLLGVPLHVATATSTFILAFSALFGSATYLAQGQISLYYGVWLTLGAIIGAQLGARIAPKVNSKLLLRILAGVMIVVSLRLILG